MKADFSAQPVSVVAIDEQGVRVTAPDGSAPQALPWDNVLELDRPTSPAAATAPFDLYLTTGDRIAGQPVAVAGERLTWRNPLVGEVQVPLSQLAAIGKGGKPPEGLDDARTEDVVRFANGDAVTGIVGGVTADGVSIQSGDNTNTVPFDNVAAVLFAAQPGKGRKNARGFRVHLHDGSSVAVPAVTTADDKLTLAFDANAKRDVDLSAVDSVEQVNGPIGWLTSRSPSENVYKPFFGESFPTRFDKTVDGGVPIRQRFPAFRHGIGCHSYSRLTYPLDGAYAAFRTQYVVDSDSPLADVTVRILLDGHATYEAKNVKAGKPSQVVLLDLSGAKTLTLEVDYGENYATEDRFAWLDPALLRTMPPPPATEPAPTPATAPADATTLPTASPLAASPTTGPATQP